MNFDFSSRYYSWIYGGDGGVKLVKFFINICNFLKNFHDPRASNNIDIKVGLLSEIQKRNKIKPKRFDDEVILAYYDVAFIFVIYCRFGAIGKPESRCNSCFFINNYL